MITTLPELPVIAVNTNVHRAIKHAFRYKILQHVLAHPGENQTQMMIKLRLDLDDDQSMLSQHIRVLRESGWIRTEREGKYITYYVNEKLVEAYAQSIRLLNQAAS